MDFTPEEVIIYFMSYAGIPFKGEATARQLTIEWGDGECETPTPQSYCPIFHTYATEGLQQIRLRGKGITSLDISRLSLTEVHLKHCPYLEYLNCSVNELHALDLQHCPALEELICNSNNLRELDLTPTPLLCHVDVSYNALEKLDLSSCSMLQRLFCSNNRLQYLDLTPCTCICELETENNMLVQNPYPMKKKE